MARTQNGQLGPRDRPTDACSSLKPPFARIFTRISVWLRRNRRPWSTEIWQSRFLLCACGLLLSTSSETTGVTSPVAQLFIFWPSSKPHHTSPSPVHPSNAAKYLYSSSLFGLKRLFWWKCRWIREGKMVMCNLLECLLLSFQSSMSKLPISAPFSND